MVRVACEKTVFIMIMMPQVCELLYSLRRNGPVLFMQILYIYTILCPVPLGNYAKHACTSKFYTQGRRAPKYMSADDYSGAFRVGH